MSGSNELSYIDIVEAEAARFSELARRDLTASVDTCPEWDVSEVVGHVGQVHRFAATVIEARATEALRPPPEDPPSGAAIVDWFDDGARRLIEAMRGLGPEEPIWSWTGDDNGRFWHRRMAHELVVHRWDVARAVGGDTTIDPEVASDGVDEVCHVGLRFSTSRPDRTYPAGSLHLHRTDGDGEWMIRPVGDTIEVTREHAKGDIAVRGPAVDLLLYLWGRPHGELDTFGDDDLVRAWHHVAP